MIQKKWFRIETDAEGNILSCEEVSSKGRQGAVVRYYEALTKADACKQAKEWYANMRSYQNAYRSNRDKSRRDAGLCIACGKRPPDKGQARCVPCKSVVNAATARWKRGDSVPQHRDPVRTRERVLDSARRERAKNRDKWGTLQAYRHFLTLSRLRQDGPGALDAWLCDRIRKAGGGAALDEYERERSKQRCDGQAEAAE